ncbi:RING/FYVE/PHD-type zinc finger family protein [Actinidia rufa]|uniref:RING/FYVE/PHD-type zinc finger family protein n=1 Tax=Actinidia rufa TaxID=165716 RepID=A0A7J0G5U4_9ERIC|nr:RING/FYVE/PHD-type zinc finger family protein [Actinidia rufa]
MGVYFDDDDRIVSEEFHQQQEHDTVCLMSQQMAKQEAYGSELPPPRTEQNSEITRLAKHEECDNELPQQEKQENDEKSCFLYQEMSDTEECDSELPHCEWETNEEKRGLPSQPMAKPEKYIEIAHHRSMDDDQKSDFVRQAMHDQCEILSQHTREVNDEKNGFMDQQTDKDILCDTKLPQCFSEENGEKGESTLGHRKLGKYFFYDSPLSEETGDWIPVSVPPISESQHEEWARGFYPSGGYFPEGDIGWSQCTDEDLDHPYLMDQVSHGAQLPTHDVTDLSTLRSWINFPWGQSMEYEIYKATNTIRGCSDNVSSLRPEKAIPDAILRQAKGLAILIIVKVGMMITYNIGTGLVIACREDGSWSPPYAISSFVVGWELRLVEN